VRKLLVELLVCRLERSAKFWLDEDGSEFEEGALFDLAAPGDLGVTHFPRGGRQHRPVAPEGELQPAHDHLLPWAPV
jgi:hypothetical protein